MWRWQWRMSLGWRMWLDDVCDEDFCKFYVFFSNFPCSIEKGIALELKHLLHLQSSPLSLWQKYFPYFFHGVCDGGQVLWITPRMSEITSRMSKSCPKCQISCPECQKLRPVKSYTDCWTSHKTGGHIWHIFCVNAAIINILFPRNLYHQDRTNKLHRLTI